VRGGLGQGQSRKGRLRACSEDGSHLPVEPPVRVSFDAPSTGEETIIMTTIQITLPDDLHHRPKLLATANRTTMKQLVLDAIEAHVERMDTAMTKRSAKKGAAR
jgi:predicted DNA-binding protein